MTTEIYSILTENGDEYKLKLLPTVVELSEIIYWTK